MKHFQKCQPRCLLTGAAILGLLLTGMATQSRAQAGADQAKPTDFRSLSYDQRVQLNRQLERYKRELSLRMVLENASLTDKAAQDAVITFVNDQQDATEELSERGQLVMRAMLNQATPEAEVNTIFNDFQAAVAKESARRSAAQAELDTKTQYSKKPRVAAALTILGILGDDMAITESVAGQSGQSGFGRFW